MALATIVWWLGAGSLPMRAEPPIRVAIYLFWAEGCPHCAEAKPFLEALAQRNPALQVRSYEVGHSEANAVLFARMAAARGFPATAVPTIVLGERAWIGFGRRIAAEIEAAAAACLTSQCPDAGAGLIAGIAARPAVPPPKPAAGEPAAIMLPLLGTIELAGQALWVSTLLIAFVDGFNPCSLWVLSVLVALALHTGSRRKVLLIGLIFLTVTAGIYALFIAGLFGILSVAEIAGPTRVAAAAMALLFGAINVKDYFLYKRGISLTIDDRAKPAIYGRMRRVLEASGSLWGLAAATVALAAGVSLVEFSCTAGFPVLWTNLVATQSVSAATFGLLLLLYLIVYQLDELAVFLLAVVTLKASRIEERQGRRLKLIGGMLMLTLAAVMLVEPGLMSRLESSLAIFAAAFAASGLVLLLHRKILSALGIRSGDRGRR